MSIAVRSFTTGGLTNATSGNINLVLPSGVVNGDVLLAIIDPLILKSITPPGGWAARESSPNTSGTFLITSYSKIAASESGSYNFAYSSTSGHDSPSVLLALSGCVASPYDTGSNYGTGSTSTTIPLTGLTTANANEMLIAAFMYKNNSTFTPPAGMSLVTSVSGATAGWTLSVCSQIQASAGATGTRTATIATTSAAAEAMMVAFIPSTITPQFWTDFIKSAEVDT